jgi:hypothetical protein
MSEILVAGLYAILVVQLFAGWTVANEVVTEHAPVGTALLVQALDKVYLAINAIVDSAKRFDWRLQA